MVTKPAQRQAQRIVLYLITSGVKERNSSFWFVTSFSTPTSPQLTPLLGRGWAYRRMRLGMLGCRCVAQDGLTFETRLEPSAESAWRGKVWEGSR